MRSTGTAWARLRRAWMVGCAVALIGTGCAGRSTDEGQPAPSTTEGPRVARSPASAAPGSSTSDTDTTSEEPVAPAREPVVHVVGTFDLLPGQASTTDERYDVFRSDLATIGALGCAPTEDACTPDRAIGLAALDIDVLSLATSAADDAGAEPLRELASSLSTRGISVVGFGSSAVDAVSPALFTTAGVLVAIHAISIIDDDGPSAIAAVDAPGIAGPDSADLLLESVVESLLAGADVIVLVNWGDADARAPTAEQLEFMDRLIETGATAIVGNGPRLERYELVESVPVAHSLGPASTDETDPLLVDAAIARLVLPDASASCLVPATASIAGPIPDRSLTDGCDRPE